MGTRCGTNVTRRPFACSAASSWVTSGRCRCPSIAYAPSDSLASLKWAPRPGERPAARLQPAGGLRRPDVVGQAAEDDVLARGIGLGVENAIDAEQRKNVGVRPAREGPGCELRQLNSRVPGEEMDERHTGVPVG